MRMRMRKKDEEKRVHAPIKDEEQKVVGARDNKKRGQKRTKEKFC